MLDKVKSLRGYKLHGLDGEIGSVKEFYFDDCDWRIRYLIADTGDWLTDRQVLIPPHALVSVNKEEQYITINLTKKQIEDSPPLDSDKPVSRQFEESYYAHYGWPLYWSEIDMIYPIIEHDFTKEIETIQDSHLRSTYEVTGYDIQATDGEIGHVADFIIDDKTWIIRYLIIGTRNWWPGKKVLISTKWIDRVSWKDMKIFVKLLRESIMQSPEYTEESLLTRDYETDLHRHYNCQAYWADETKEKEHSL